MNQKIMTFTPSASININPHRILDFILLFIILHATFPPLNVLVSFGVGQIIGATIWIILAFLLRPKFFMKFDFHISIWIFLIAYTCLIPRMFDNATIGNRSLSFGMNPFFYIAYLYNRDSPSGGKRNLNILWMMSPFVIVTTIYTITALLEDPFASRLIKVSGSVNTDPLMARGIGGYDYIYMLLIITILLSYYIASHSANKNRKIHFIVISTVMLIVFLYTLILSNFFTALILYLVAVAAMFLFSRVRIIYKLFTIATVFIAMTLLWVRMHDSIPDLFGKSRTAERISIMQSGDTASLLEDREDANSLSRDVISSHLLAGLVVEKIHSDGEFLEGFGQHSHFLDTFALFGIVIGFLQIYCMLQPFWTRLFGSRGFSSLAVGMICSAALLSTYNNIPPSVGFALYFLYPVIYDHLQGELRIQAIGIIG